MSRTFRKQYPPYESSFDSVKDGKKWYKPPKIFKHLQKKKRKAKEKQALKKDPDLIPKFPKTDVWDYN